MKIKGILPDQTIKKEETKLFSPYLQYLDEAHRKQWIDQMHRQAQYDRVLKKIWTTNSPPGGKMPTRIRKKCEAAAHSVS